MQFLHNLRVENANPGGSIPHTMLINILYAIVLQKRATHCIDSDQALENEKLGF
jgi:hypothetical protein